LYSVSTTPVYTLLGSYNASKINETGTNVTLPNGTKYTKIEYNLQTRGTGKNIPHFTVTGITSNNLISGYNIMKYNNFVTVIAGQNKTGTMIINNTETEDNSKITDIFLQASGIQGKIKIYTSK
jgi:hypothetical protein